LGLGMGQVNRVDAVAHSIERMQKHHKNHQNAVLASDAFFPFSDSISLIAKAGIKWVLQPGGALKDSEVIAEAKTLGINMIFSGTRHFKH
ncbi:MAG: bifunctional phosphoribosylaminoimidazolecarboxamide formyltransferase/IMP cyclohydrolase, partial [Pseudobdellovibrionaceae bacterium]